MLQASARLPWVLVVSATLLAACGSARSRFDSHLQRGERYFDAGQYDKASVEFRNALQIDPRSAKARYLNGEAAERRGELREALGSYQAAIELDPDYSAARAAVGRVLVFGGAADRALTVIAPGLTRHPDEPQLLTARGAARAQLGDLNGAIADAEHALKVAPDDENALALLASLYQRQGEAPRAVALVAEAVGRHPNSIDLRQVLAGLYLATADNGRAEEQLKAIIALAPRELPHRYQLALFYERTGNPDAARHVLEEAVQAFPTSSIAKLALVDFVAGKHSPRQGEQLLRSYIAREPDNDDLRLGLGALLQRSGAARQAQAAYEEIVSRDPHGRAALLARDRIAAIELAGGRIDAARTLLAVALADNPTDNDALIMSGEIALGRDDPDAAIGDFRAVLRDQPNALNVERALARAYVANGENALAEETLRAALQAAPNDLAVRSDLAQLLVQGGRADAAASLLEEAVRRSPEDAAARAALVRAYLAKGDLTAARTAAQDLENLKPAAALGPYLAGVVARQQDRPDESERNFERALQLDPGDLDALGGLTSLELARGHQAAALADVRAFAAAHAGNAAALNLLGELLIATRDYPGAIGQLKQAVALAPRWPTPYHNLARACRAAQDAAGAASAYPAGLKQVPSDPLLVAGLAELYEQQGRVAEAIAVYEDLLAHRPHATLAANNLAMLLVTYRTDRRSLDQARELSAAFSGSDSGALLDTNGWVRLKLGDLTDALPALERAAGHSPDSRVIRYHLAVAELKAGQRDKARENLETALSGSGSFAGSDDARARLNALNAGGRG
jgi:tetratricopeptide (TPR) repeat protein